MQYCPVAPVCQSKPGPNNFTHLRDHSLAKNFSSALVTNKCAYAFFPRYDSNHFAIRTKTDASPVRIANIEYPVLCQSIRSLAFVIWVMKEASARVGIEGGFCTRITSGWNGNVKRAICSTETI